MKLTFRDLAEKKLRLVESRSKKIPRVSPVRKPRRIPCNDDDEDASPPCNLWEEIAMSVGHDFFLTVKMSGQTAKYTQQQSDIDWFCNVAPRKAAAVLIGRFNEQPQDFVFLSEGDKLKDSKVADCVESGVAATIAQTMNIVQKHMDSMREFVKAQFHCMVWGASNANTSKFVDIFGQDRVLGASERKFATPSNIAEVWPGIEKCRAIKYAGSHFEATWAADITFRIEGDRPLTDTALSFYGPKRIGQDYFIRPTQTAISTALRSLIRTSSSCA